jgi:hypothetical protein
MPDQDKDPSLVDPLSDVTRKERRMLLGLSMLGIFFVHAGILPTKINALGIELQATDQSAFLYLLSLCLVYFMAAFFIYATSDFIVWRKAMMKKGVADFMDQMNAMAESPPSHPDEQDLEDEKNRLYSKNKIWFSLTRPMSVSRAIFEFALPLAVGIYAVIALVRYASTNT